MEFEPLVFTKMGADDTFKFQCSRCGECCHNVKGAILLSSLDLFRIARHRGQTTETIFSLFADVYMMDERIKFPILMLKTKQQGDVCWLYRTGRCSIHEAKPLTCKLYPMNIGPYDNGNLEYFLVSQRQHHYTGTEHRAGDWMAEFLTPDDRRFMLRWYELAVELGRLMRQVISAGKVPQTDICVRAVWYMYLRFDINSEFWPQFDRNIELLKQEMRDAARGIPYRKE